MTNKTISPLRQRMIEDMTVRRFTAKTQSDYIRSVRNLAAFLGRSPDTATAEDLRLFQLHLTETHIGPPTINGTVSALRFFFTVTLGRADVARSLTFVAEPRKIPVVLSPEEVARFLEAAPGPKYKAALGAAYGAGLRVSEVASLKVSDIDSKRMLLRIEQGKGRKDRYAMLSPVRCRQVAHLRGGAAEDSCRSQPRGGGAAPAPLNSSPSGEACSATTPQMSIKPPPISLAARSHPPTFFLYHMVLCSGS